MIRFTVRTLLKNRVLWAWPGIFILFVGAIAVWGGISPAPSSSSYLIELGDIDLPAGMIINQIVSMVILITIIGMPTHFAESLKPERASLLLSKPISRTEFFFSDIAGVSIIYILYAAISVILLALLTIVHGILFPFQHVIALLIFLPLTLIAYYITIILFIILTNSYLGGVLLGYFLTGFSALFINVEQFMKMVKLFGLEDTYAVTIFKIAGYFIPSAAAFQQIMQDMFNSGLSSIDLSLFGYAFATCLPFLLLSYYLLQKKQF